MRLCAVWTRDFTGPTDLRRDSRSLTGEAFREPEVVAGIECLTREAKQAEMRTGYATSNMLRSARITPSISDFHRINVFGLHFHTSLNLQADFLSNKYPYYLSFD